MFAGAHQNQPAPRRAHGVQRVGRWPQGELLPSAHRLRQHDPQSPRHDSATHYDLVGQHRVQGRCLRGHEQGQDGQRLSDRRRPLDGQTFHASTVKSLTRLKKVPPGPIGTDSPKMSPDSGFGLAQESDAVAEKGRAKHAHCLRPCIAHMSVCV